MHNDTHCQAENKRWDELIQEAKLRLVDATEPSERKEWRRSLRALEVLKRRKVRLPIIARKMGSATK
jgi:hypothetical protein